MMFFSEKILLLSKIEKLSKVGKNREVLSISPILNGFGETYGALIRKFLFSAVPSYKIISFKFLQGDAEEINLDSKLSLYSKIDGMEESILFLSKNLESVIFETNYQHIDAKKNIQGEIIIDRLGEYTAADIKFSSDGDFLKQVSNNVLFTIQ